MEVNVGGRNGYVAIPSAPSTRGVLVLHEAYGLTADIRRIADRFAVEGYVAAAPNLFGGIRCLARTLNDEKRAADLNEWHQYLRREHGVERAGIIGFCMGGGFALAHAARPDSDLLAVSVNYGAMTTSDLSHVCPVVASYGERDRVMLPQARKLGAALDAAGVDNDFRIYEGVGHSFMNHHEGLGALLSRLPTGMKVGYDEAAAVDAWKRILAFFAARV